MKRGDLLEMLLYSNYIDINIGIVYSQYCTNVHLETFEAQRQSPRADPGFVGRGEGPERGERELITGV